jgi:hypothetical protein
MSHVEKTERRRKYLRRARVEVIQFVVFMAVAFAGQHVLEMLRWQAFTPFVAVAMMLVVIVLWWRRDTAADRNLSLVMQLVLLATSVGLSVWSSRR